MLKKLFLSPSGNQGTVFLIIFNALYLWAFFTFYRIYLDSPDMVESYAWGMSWALGNNKHPPLYSWITALWFQLFPTRNWAYYLLGEINLLIALVFLMLCMRKKLDANKSALMLKALVTYAQFKAERHNRQIRLDTVQRDRKWLSALGFVGVTRK